MHPAHKKRIEFVTQLLYTPSAFLKQPGRRMISSERHFVVSHDAWHAQAEV